MSYRFWDWNQEYELQPNRSSQHLLSDDSLDGIGNFIRNPPAVKGSGTNLVLPQPSSAGSSRSNLSFAERTPAGDPFSTFEQHDEDSNPSKIALESTRTVSGANRAGEAEAGSERAKCATIWSFVLLLLACIIVSLTIIYSSHTSITGKLFATSSSQSLLILRVLSETCTVILALLVTFVLEDLQWAFASRPTGIGLLGFLSLDAGTRVWGLLRLLFVSGKAAHKRYSFVRLCLLIIVPLPGIVVMSSLSIVPFFATRHQYPVAAGLADFNATTALSMNQQGATSLMFDIGNPQWDGRISIPMKPLGKEYSRCHSSKDPAKQVPCEESYLLTGGCLTISPQQDDLQTDRDATIYVVEKTKGYQVEFETATDQSMLREQSLCKTYGYDIGAVYSCVALGASQELVHGYGVCPLEMIADKSCLTDLSWTENPFDFATSFYVHRRAATVYYWRYNLSIAAITDLATPTFFPIPAKDLFLVFDIVMRSINFRGDINASDTTSSDLALFMAGGLQQSQNPFVRKIALLQNRKSLALMLHYFHANNIGAGAPQSIWDLTAPRAGLPPDMYTTLRIAIPTYHVVASRLSLYIFIGVASFLLLLCFTTSVFTCGSVTHWPKRTGYPTLDFAIYCLPTRTHHQRSLYKTVANLRGKQEGTLTKELSDARFIAN